MRPRQRQQHPPNATRRIEHSIGNRGACGLGQKPRRSGLRRPKLAIKPPAPNPQQHVNNERRHPGSRGGRRTILKQVGNLGGRRPGLAHEIRTPVRVGQQRQPSQGGLQLVGKNLDEAIDKGRGD